MTITGEKLKETVTKHLDLVSDGCRDLRKLVRTPAEELTEGALFNILQALRLLTPVVANAVTFGLNAAKAVAEIIPPSGVEERELSQPLVHGMNCSANRGEHPEVDNITDPDCTCGLYWRIEIGKLRRALDRVRTVVQMDTSVNWGDRLVVTNSRNYIRKICDVALSENLTPQTVIEVVKCPNCQREHRTVPGSVGHVYCPCGNDFLIADAATAASLKAESEPRSRATQLVHWPGHDTRACDRHADQLRTLAKHMGFTISITACVETNAECENCENERATANARLSRAKA